MRYIVSHLTRPTTRTWPPSGLRKEKRDNLCEIDENIMDLSSDTLESINYETEETRRTDFLIEKLTNLHPTTIRMI